MGIFCSSWKSFFVCDVEFGTVKHKTPCVEICYLRSIVWTFLIAMNLGTLYQRMPLGYFVLPCLHAVIGCFRGMFLWYCYPFTLTTTLWRTWRNGNIVPRILHRLDTRCRSVMRFLSRPFYSRRYKVRYPAHRRHSRVRQLGWTRWRRERNRPQKHQQNKSLNCRSSNEVFCNMHTIHSSDCLFIVYLFIYFIFTDAVCNSN